MKSRRSARRMALGILYEGEIREMSPRETWAVHVSPEGHFTDPLGADGFGGVEEGYETPDPDAIDYARRLIQGVEEHLQEIDVRLTTYADRWALDRMPVVDRNLLRIGMFELLWGDDIPVAVAINEAVELAKRYSTDDSGRFVNGLLGRAAEELKQPTVQPHREDHVPGARGGRQD